MLTPTAIIGASILAGSSTGGLCSIAIDASGAFYALDTSGTNTIYVFAPGSGTRTPPSATITSSSLNYAQQITVSP